MQIEIGAKTSKDGYRISQSHTQLHALYSAASVAAEPPS